MFLIGLDPNYSNFSVGAIEKVLLQSSENAEPPLIPNHKYLLKFSSKTWMPWQFWSEVVACMFGKFINLPVPKAYVGKQNQRCGVLVE
jgi:hypothetical protein